MTTQHETKLDFELSSRKQLGYLIKSLNNSKTWAIDKCEEGHMDGDTRDSLILLSEQWVRCLRKTHNEFLDEYYPEQ